MDWALRDTLKGVADAMLSAHDPWWIIGIAAAALHGASPIRVAEVDVLVSARDAKCIARAIGVESAGKSVSDRFLFDFFATWHDNPLPVSLMSGIRVYNKDIWESVIFQQRVPIRVEHATLYVPSVIEVLGTLTAFGRSKDVYAVDALLCQIHNGRNVEHEYSDGSPI